MIQATKLGNDIWNNPLKLGTRRRCVACNGLVLRKRNGNHGNQPKYCTEKCRDRYDKKLRYWRYKETERERVKLWKLAHPERVKETNAYHRNKRQERINYKYSYLETLKA